MIKKIVVIEEVPNYKKGFMDDDLFAPDDDVDISEWWEDYSRVAFAGYYGTEGSPAM